MNNTELKGIITEMLEDVVEQDEIDRILLLESDEFASAAIGLSADNRVVYSREKLLDALMKSMQDEDLEDAESEALNILENIAYFLPYMEKQGLMPIVISEFEHYM